MRHTEPMAVSVRDVARAARVSVGTVSNALNHPDRLAPSTLERVLTAIDEVGFVRNDAARQLRAGSSTAIGLVVLDIANPFFAELVRGAEDRAAEAGRTVLLANSAQDPDREAEALAHLQQQRVAGVVLSPHHVDHQRIDRLLALGIDVVLVDRVSPDSEVPSVSVDDVSGGHLAAAHLIAIGRRRIGFVGGPRSLAQVADRLAGAEQAVARAEGVRLIDVPTESLGVNDGRLAGEAIVALSPSDRPDAVFTANDLVAFGILQSFRSAGVSVPDDIAVVGYDDIEFAAWFETPLTSIRQPAWLLGHTAVDIMLRSGGDDRPDNVVFTPELITRSSTIGTSDPATPSNSAAR